MYILHIWHPTKENSLPNLALLVKFIFWEGYHIWKSKRIYRAERTQDKLHKSKKHQDKHHVCTREQCLRFNMHGSRSKRTFWNQSLLDPSFRIQFC